MADGSKDVAKAIDKMTREMSKTLNDIGKQMNKALGRMAEALEQKQFDELIPPPKGTVYQNMRGTTLIGSEDFNEIYDVWCRVNERGYQPREPKPITEDNQMAWEEYEEENE